MDDAFQIFYEGKVQGVGFRYATKQIAMGYDISGWVKNLADGRVEMQVVGDIEEIADFCKELEEESALSGQIREIEKKQMEEIPEIVGFSIQ